MALVKNTPCEITISDKVELNLKVVYGGGPTSQLSPLAKTLFAAMCKVCFDSTFPHFRVKMKGAYEQRRQRMQELMTKEFTKIGFPSMMLGRRSPDSVGVVPSFFWV